MNGHEKTGGGEAPPVREKASGEIRRRDLLHAFVRVAQEGADRLRLLVGVARGVEEGGVPHGDFEAQGAPGGGIRGGAEIFTRRSQSTVP